MKFHTENPQILGTTVQNSIAMATPQILGATVQNSVAMATPQILGATVQNSIAMATRSPVLVHSCRTCRTRHIIGALT
jgi:hypothetical protein